MQLEGSCSGACEALEQLGCPEAEPSPAGVACVDVCTNMQEAGLPFLDVGCVVEATSVDAVRLCHVRCAR